MDISIMNIKYEKAEFCVQITNKQPFQNAFTIESCQYFLSRLRQKRVEQGKNSF